MVWLTANNHYFHAVANISPLYLAQFDKANINFINVSNRTCRDERDEVSGSWVEIRNIVFPSLASSLIEPALSIIDTFFIGRSALPAVANQFAGMAINSALFSLIAEATGEFGPATTAVVSELAGESKRTNSDVTTVTESVKETLRKILSLAVCTGMSISFLIAFMGRHFLRHGFNLNDDLLDTANAYLQIRGLSIPTVLANYVVFGFSVAMQDILAPILSISTAFWVNVLGDYLLVGKLGWGLAGAAAATTWSSYLGSTISLIYLFRKYKLNFKLPRRFDPVTGKEGGDIDWNRVKLVDKAAASVFFTASGALLAGSLANTLTYSAGARISSFTSSAAQSTIEIAAHQIVMQVWWFLSYFSSPFNLVAQAVFPRDLVAKNPLRVKAMTKLLLTCRP